jgi:cytochrome b561
MQASPAVNRYTATAMILHWTVAALIGLNLVLIWFVDDWPKAWDRPVIDLHKSIGITVLGLVLMRLLWRAANPPPALPADMAVVEKSAAHVAHWVLYGLILALPLSGWMHDSAWSAAPSHPMKLFWLAPWPRIGLIETQPQPFKDHLHTLLLNFHKWFAYALYGVFALHVAGALKHQFIDKQAELQRMLPGRRTPASS